jgi:hydroxyacylglutathione hydrolase
MQQMIEEIRRINLGFVNAYLLKIDTGYILIDTGISQQWSHLESELLASAALPDQLKLVILTHGDFDHSGNCAELQRKYHLKIAMHTGDAGMVKAGMPAKRRSKSYSGKILVRLTGMMRGSFHKFQPDILLEDSQDLTGFGLDGRVIYTPGHTKGSIAILTTDGMLFPGDTVANRRKPASADYIQNELELDASLAKLKGLNARTVYPGHGEPFGFEKLASI